MTNNTDTKVPSGSWSESFTNPTNYIVGILIGLFATMIAVAWFFPHEESPVSSAATAEVTTTPTIETSWLLNGGYVGSTAAGPTRSLRVSMQNDLVHCRPGDPMNCCLATVEVDNVEDKAMGRELCAALLAASPGPGPVDELQLEWFLRNTVDDFYEHHFGDVPSYSHSSTRHVERVR